jgi:hypothetical protein
MKEKLEEQLFRSSITNTNLRFVGFSFTKYERDDPRRFNIPKVGEISAVFSDPNGEPPSDINFLLYPKNESRGVTNLTYMNPNCDPMVYPLLFPYGERGWSSQLKHEKEKRYFIKFNINIHI